jgi:hypothetical protein
MQFNPSALDIDALENLPTLHQGHDKNMKIDSRYIRVWMIRTGDDNIRQVYIEALNNRGWEELLTITQHKIKGNSTWVDCDESMLDA